MDGNCGEEAVACFNLELVSEQLRGNASIIERQLQNLHPEICVRCSLIAQSDVNDNL